MSERVFLFDTPNYFDINYKDDKKRGLVVIVPGGGYDHTSLREGESVSNAFLSQGYHTVIIRYRETLDTHPFPMNALAYTIDYVRKLTLVDSNKIITIGFSAGAHLVAMVGTHFEDLEYDCKPNLMVLSYPVIVNDKPYAHEGSFKYLLGDKIDDKELLKYTNIALNVKPNIPPTFMWHTADDESVPCYNSLDMVKALKENHVKFEYHLFPSGVHGLSMATEESAMGDERKVNPYVSRWFKLCMDFINSTL